MVLYESGRDIMLLVLKNANYKVRRVFSLGAECRRQFLQRLRRIGWRIIVCGPRHLLRFRRVKDHYLYNIAFMQIGSCQYVDTDYESPGRAYHPSIHPVTAEGHNPVCKFFTRKLSPFSLPLLFLRRESINHSLLMWFCISLPTACLSYDPWWVHSILLNRFRIKRTPRVKEWKLKYHKDHFSSLTFSSSPTFSRMSQSVITRQG